MLIDPTRCEYEETCSGFGNTKVFIRPAHGRGYWIMCETHADLVMA